MWAAKVTGDLVLLDPIIFYKVTIIKTFHIDTTREPQARKAEKFKNKIQISVKIIVFEHLSNAVVIIS